MKRPARVAFLLLACLAVGLGSIAAGLVFFTGPVAEIFVRVASVTKPGVVSVRGVSGSLWRGIFVEDLRLSLPMADVAIRRAYVGLRLAPLLYRRIVVDAARADGFTVRLKPAPAAAKKVEPAGGPSPWRVEARGIRLDDGHVAWGNPPAAVEGIRLRASFVDDVLTVDEADAAYGEYRAALAGSVNAARREGTLRAGVRGPGLEARLRASGGVENFSFRVIGAWRGVDVNAHGTLSNKSDWRVDLRADGRPDVLAEKFGTPGVITAHAEGRGLVWPDIAGDARLDARMPPMPAVGGTLRLQGGALRADLSLRGPATSGGVRAEYAVAEKRVKADIDLRTAASDWAALVPAWSGGRASARAGLDGVWPQVRWNADATADGVKAGGASIASAKISAHGQDWPPASAAARASAEGVAAGKMRVDRARVDVSGRLPSHKVAVAVDSGDVSVRAQADAALDGGIWSARWTSLTARAVTAWRAAPFATRFGPGVVEVTGFDLGDGNARLRADAELADKTWRRIRAEATGFDAEVWRRAGLWPWPVSGVFNASATLHGDAGGFKGGGTLRVTSASVNGVAAGVLDAAGRIDDRTFSVERLTLAGPLGGLTAAGRVVLSARPGAAPDVSLTLRSAGLALDPFVAAVPGVKAEQARLTADLKVDSEGDSWKAFGEAKLTAAHLTADQAGVSAQNFRLNLAARGDHVEFFDSGAEWKTGNVRVDGTLSRGGPDVAVAVRDYMFKSPLGASGRVEGDLHAGGAWTAPVVTGDVRLLQADYRPPKKEKKDKKNKKQPPAPPPPAKEPETPSPLAVDVRLRFDRDVWYKSGDSAVEAAGDLRAQKDPGGPLSVTGTVQTVRGRYVYLGKTFEVQPESQVVLTGPMPEGLRFDVSAVYVVPANRTKITLHLTGQWPEPQLSLSSEPSLPEDDIVALLLFGRPLDTGGSGGAGGTDQEALARQVAVNYALGQLKETGVFRRLDLDVFQVGTTTEGGVDLTVGRYLTKNLYVTYEQSVEESGRRRLGAEYILTPHWSLKGGSASDGRSVVDLIFRFPM